MMYLIWAATKTNSILVTSFLIFHLMSLSSIFLCPFGAHYNMSLNVIKRNKLSISGWSGPEWKKVETSMLGYHISINVV